MFTRVGQWPCPASSLAPVIVVAFTAGIVKGLVNGSCEAWRTAFTTGLVAGGGLLTLLLPTAFEALPPAYTFLRAVTSGLLVGFGTSMGNGCTRWVSWTGPASPIGW